jgi:hypothetical protein
MYSARLISLFSYLLFSQILTASPVRHFKISGTISGEYQGKIYLFFEDHYRQKDSISSEITNGRFHFSGDISMPVLCRIHLDQESLIADFFMDAPTLSLACTNKISLLKNKKLQSDTLNNLTIARVEGSATEDLKSNFEKQLTVLMASNRSPGAKDTAYFDNNPSVKALYEKYKENKFEILGVSWDTDPDKWKKAIVKDRLSWPQAIDPKKELGNFYAIEAIPANMLLDKNGRILGVGLSNEEIEKFIYR